MNLVELANSLPSGDYAEVGVYKGHGAEKIAKYMDPKERLWLFDSFAGHDEPSEFDHPDHYEGRYSDNSIAEVQAMVPNAHIIVGYVPESLSIVANQKFRYVKIDVDQYWPTRGACEFFKPRMVKGGIIEFDDYNMSTCDGATKAIDETFPENLNMPDPGCTYWWVK